MTVSYRFGVFLTAGIIVIAGSEIGERLSVPGVHSLIPTAEARVGRPLTPVSLESAVGRRPGWVPGGVWQGATRRNSRLLQRVVTQPGAVRRVHWVA